MCKRRLEGAGPLVTMTFAFLSGFPPDKVPDVEPNDLTKSDFAIIVLINK
jgi:hypothetical protein